MSTDTAASAPLTPARFVGLDVLRGIAALSVVFWHWQHFYYTGAEPGHPAPADLPLHQVFSLLYAKGWLAVDLFFMLSGFIFFCFYRQRIHSRSMSAAHFAWLRFSRLYPLHLATLVAVAIAVAWIGVPSVYRWNDAWHFGLQLSMASAWGLERGESFNGPIWSVSVEVLVYGAFFIWCYSGRFEWRGALFVALLGYLVIKPLVPSIGRGIGGFFMGACMFAAYSHGSARGTAMAARAAGAAAVLAWCATLASHYLPYGSVPHAFASAWPILLFALTLLAFALNEPLLGRLLRKLQWLGDASYAIYLLHYPLQMLLIGVAVHQGWPGSIYASPGMLLAFMLLLLAGSVLVHRSFELPAQRQLRALHH